MSTLQLCLQLWKCDTTPVPTEAPIAGTIDFPQAFIGTPYTYSSVSVFSGGAVEVWTYSGVLPAGIEFIGGVYTGVPTTLQTQGLATIGTNVVGSDTTNIDDLVIHPAIPVFSGNIPDLDLDQFVAMTPFNASSYFTGASSYTATNLPTGITIDSGTGTISGTPTGIQVNACTVAGVNSDSSASTDSNSFTVSVEEAQPVITLNPVSQTVTEPDGFTLTMTADNALSYQWYENTVLMPGETSTSLTVASSVESVNDYYCIATNVAKTAQTTTATVTVEVSLEPTGSNLQIIQSYPSGIFPGLSTSTYIKGSILYVASLEYPVNGVVYLNSFDVSDPLNVTLLQTYTIPIDTVPEYELNGLVVNDSGIAFLSAEPSVVISIDVSTPTNMVLLDTFTDVTDLERPGAVFIEGNTVFVCCDSRNDSNITAIDVTNPAAMSKAGTWYDAAARRSKDMMYDSASGVMFIISNLDNVISSVNVSNPASMSTIQTRAATALTAPLYLEYNSNIDRAFAHKLTEGALMNVSNPASMVPIDSTGAATNFYKGLMFDDFILMYDSSEILYSLEIGDMTTKRSTLLITNSLALRQMTFNEKTAYVLGFDSTDGTLDLVDIS